MNSADNNEDPIPPGPHEHRTLDRLLTRSRHREANPPPPVQRDEARRPVVPQARVKGYLQSVQHEPGSAWSERVEIWLAWIAIAAVVVAVIYVVVEALAVWSVGT